jgi:hypothetical protein
MTNIYNIFTKEKMPEMDELAEDLATRLSDIQADLIPVLEKSNYAPVHVAMALILITEKIAHNIKTDENSGPFRKDIDKGLDQFREIVRRSQKI